MTDHEKEFLDAYEKEIWLEGHYSGLAAAAIMMLAQEGVIGEDNDSFVEAFKVTLRDDKHRLLDEETSNTMYNLWRSERYEKLVEEYFDGEGIEETPAV